MGRTKAEHAAYMRQYMRDWKARDPEGYRANVRERTVRANANGKNAIRQRRANRKRRAVLDAIKQFLGCADCGAKHLPPECYDFDHRPGEVKRFMVGVNMRRGWSRILDEIQRCDCVCSNCHRTRTVKRKRGAGLLETPERLVDMVDHQGRWRDLWAMAAARGLLPPAQ